MALLPPSSDYTDKDFDSLRARLISLIRSVFPDWTDFDVAGFGTVLLEMFAFVGDVATHYADNAARESRLVTSTQRRNVIALARMLGYRLHGAQAATAEIVFRLHRVMDADTRIPAGTVVRTREISDPLRFQLLSDVVIEAGQDPPEAIGVVEHSRSHTQLFDAQGLANLDLMLDHAPYLDGTATVSDVRGLYTEVESLLGAGPNDRHFLVLVDQNDRATLRFGNGASGATPAGTIRVSYKTGGGATGNIEPNQLVVIEGTFHDEHGHAVKVSVTNPAPASGGVDRQSIASAKMLAPESLRVLTRSVAREDFEVNARRLPGVARALMLTANEDPSIDENSGVLYVIPQGGGLPTPALRNQALRQITEVYPCTLTFQVNVQVPVYRRVDVHARVYLAAGHAPGAVRDRIRQRLTEWFQVSNPDGTPNRNVNFGFYLRDAQDHPTGELAWSDVFNVVRDTPGLRKVGSAPGDLTLNGLAADVKLAAREFPVLGAVTVIDGDSGALL